MARKPSTKRRKAAGGSPSPAAEFIASNIDLLTEILLRLPAKSLLRFKSVSKDWRFLISHSQFSASHSSRNPSPSISGLYFYTQSRLKSASLHNSYMYLRSKKRHNNLPSFSFLDSLKGNDSKLRILRSCNGLFLCQTGSIYKQPRYIVCNATTRKYKLVPKSSGLSCRRVVHRAAYLAFDPKKSPHYKIIVVSHYKVSESWSLDIDVYGSEGGIWSNWRNILPPGKCLGRGVFWNGEIHWLSKGAKNLLLRFDVDVGEIVMLPLPPSPRIRPNKRLMYFGECGGSLIIVRHSITSAGRFEILELESDTSGWIVKEYQVNGKTIAASALPRMEELVNFYVLCVLKGKKKEDCTLVLAIQEKVVSYNLKCDTLDVLLDLDPGELIDDGVNGRAYPFLETLSPV